MPWGLLQSHLLLSSDQAKTGYPIAGGAVPISVAGMGYAE